MRRWIWWLLPLSFLVVVGLAGYLHPDPRGYGTHHALGLPPCLFLTWTGLPCPSCGLTTSFTYLVHGHLLRSFQAHPLGPFLFAAYALLALWAVFQALGKPRPLRFRVAYRGTHVAYAGLAVFLGTWLFRVIYFCFHHNFPGIG